MKKWVAGALIGVAAISLVAGGLAYLKSEDRDRKLEELRQLEAENADLSARLDRRKKELGIDEPESQDVWTPASRAHSPTVSLSRYVSFYGTGKHVVQSPAGYWEVMIGARSSADAPIQEALIDCTGFGKDREPITEGSASFRNLSPGQVSWAKATFMNSERPYSVQCHPGVAYNLN